MLPQWSRGACDDVLKSVTQGVTLIEALVAIVVLALALLGLVKMQSHSAVVSRDAMFRAEAGVLVHELIGIMWIDRANLAGYQHRPDGSACAPSGTSATNLNALNWLAEFTTAGAQRYLPGATPEAQQIIVDTTSSPPTLRVRVCWQSPQDTGQRSFVAVSRVPP